MRDVRFNAMLNDFENDMLAELAETRNVSKAEVFRTLLRDAYHGHTNPQVIVLNDDSPAKSLLFAELERHYNLGRGATCADADDDAQRRERLYSHGLPHGVIDNLRGNELIQLEKHVTLITIWRDLT